MTAHHAARADAAPAAVATLYYDGRCGLCAGEIARLARLQRGTLALQDIHELPADSDAPGDAPDKDTLLRTLHLRTADGDWLTGADANVAAWQHTRHGWAWRWLRWPILRTLVDLAYRPWAEWRYRRLYGCGAVTESRG
jgi:predicted DCC family thiol-disulfide oxidoreductase YuxK